MIEALTGQALLDALNSLNSGLAGQSLENAYDQYMKGRYETDDGPTIGFNTWTSNKPAISGDTSDTITLYDETPPASAWNDYVENSQDGVDSTTGGIVSGSTVGTFVYSLMEENPGTASAVTKAVAPVAVTLDAAIVAMGQALGVSIDIARMDVETKDALAEAYSSIGGAIYDKAKGLVTAWKDEMGRILFPKKALEAVYDITKDWGGDDRVDYDSVPRDPMYNKTANFQLVPFQPNFSYSWGTSATDTFTFTGEGEAYAYVTNINSTVITYISTAPFTVARSHYPTSWNSGHITKGNLTYYLVTVYANALIKNWLNPPPISTITGLTDPYDGHPTWDAAYLLFNGTVIHGGYPTGVTESEAEEKYTPATIPIAGELATSPDPETGILGREELVPIHITEDPYNPTGDTTNPTDPTDDDNPGVVNPPIPLPIPDTKPSNPDVPLVNPSVIDSTLVEELVEELANTVDPQPPQSSGIIPIPQLPGITDPETGDRTFPSIIPESGPGFIHVYNPTPAEFVAFGTWLWVTYADATIEKILNNPFDGVIGAHEFYATPNREGRDNIRSAFLTCPTTADLVPNRYSEIDCGTAIVPEFYGNYLDYSPYSQAYIYLPFIGINEVSIDDIVGHAVNIRYRVDSYSGSCIAMIFVAKNGYQNLCYQFAGNCAVDVPMAGGSQAAIKAGMMQAEAYARAAQGNALGHLFGAIGSALMGSLGGTISGISGIISDYTNAEAGVEAARVANKSSVQHSGQFGASHGAMGEKVPFIIIRNPIQVKVVNYNEDYGFPAHKRVIIGGCSGYLRVREVNVISAHATDDEKAAIESMLKNGVYVS